MPYVPGLRSPYDKFGSLVYFGRMLDKIRLPEQPWRRHPKLNDGRCCRFLGIEYRALAARTLEGGTDKDILGGGKDSGKKHTDWQGS